MITTVIADGKKEYEFIDCLKKRAQSSDKDVVPAALDGLRSDWLRPSVEERIDVAHRVERWSSVNDGLACI